MHDFPPFLNFSFLLLLFVEPLTYYRAVANLKVDEMKELHGLGRHVCGINTNESVYRIAILVPFDARLEDIFAAPPPNQVEYLTFLSKLVIESKFWKFL